MGGTASDNRRKVNAHRERLRERGMRPVQFWVPDVRSPQFADEARRQALAARDSAWAASDQTFVDAISDFAPRMRRGEIWTAAGGGDYTGKPRPSSSSRTTRLQNWNPSRSAPSQAIRLTLPCSAFLSFPRAKMGLSDQAGSWRTRLRQWPSQGSASGWACCRIRK